MTNGFFLRAEYGMLLKCYSDYSAYFALTAHERAHCPESIAVSPPLGALFWGDSCSVEVNTQRLL